MSVPSGADGAPSSAQPAQPNKRMQQTQAQVDEVVDIMRVNLERVMERDERLTQLDNRADALQSGASQFETSTGKLKRKYWWQNIKMMIILGIVILAVIAVIIVAIVVSVT